MRSYDDMPSERGSRGRSDKKITFIIALIGILLTLIAIVIYLIFTPHDISGKEESIQVTPVTLKAEEVRQVVIDKSENKEESVIVKDDSASESIASGEAYPVKEALPAVLDESTSMRPDGENGSISGMPSDPAAEWEAEAGVAGEMPSSTEDEAPEADAQESTEPASEEEGSAPGIQEMDSEAIREDHPAEESPAPADAEEAPSAEGPLAMDASDGNAIEGMKAEEEDSHATIESIEEALPDIPDEKEEISQSAEESHPEEEGASVAQAESDAAEAAKEKEEPVAPASQNEDDGPWWLAYTVKNGDTVDSIASSFGINASSIVSVNRMRSVVSLTPGLRIRIPKMDGQIYIVKEDDTLISIRRRFAPSVSETELIEINGLSGELLLQGTELFIPEGAPMKERSPMFIMPIDGEVAVSFGEYLNGSRLDGVVISALPGSAVIACQDGYVVDIGNDRKYGRFVIVSHRDGYRTGYYGLETVDVKATSDVSKGQVIGSVGSSSRKFISDVSLMLTIEQNGIKLDPSLLMDMN